MRDRDPAVILEASLERIRESFVNSSPTDREIANGQEMSVDGISVEKLLTVATTPTPAGTTLGANRERERIVNELQGVSCEIRDAAITPVDSLTPLRDFVGRLDQEESAGVIDLAAGLVALTLVASSIAESYGAIPASTEVSLSTAVSAAATTNDSRALKKAAEASEDLESLINTAQYADRLWMCANDLKLPSYADPPTEFGKQLRKAVAEGNRDKLSSLEEQLAGAPDTEWGHDAVMSPTPNEFETLLADLWIQASGTADITETRRSNDAGVDVIVRTTEGRTILLQAKQYAIGNSVGRQTIQQTEGTRAQFGADQATVVTTTRFTAPAESAVENLPRMNLIDGNQLREILNQSPLIPPTLLQG